MGTTFTYAEELTLSGLRSLVLRRCRVTNTTRYSSDSTTANYDWIDAALNTGIKKFVRETKCIRSYAAYVPLENHQFYRLPESFIDIKTVYYFDASLPNGYKELIIKGIGELNDEVSDWRTATGTPKYVFVDRRFGRRWFMGLVPIPNFTGTTVTFDEDYGSKLTEICNLTTYNEEFIELPQTGEYYCPSSVTSPGKPFDNIDKDLLVEHYRLPRQLDTTTQYPELPREYHEALADYAAWELLRHNPEDSAEFKRAEVYIKAFYGEIKSFVGKRKDVGLKGKELRIRPAQQGWMQNMPFYKGMA